MATSALSLAFAASAHASFELVQAFPEQPLKSPAEALSTPQGVAVDNTTGDVYVAQQLEVLRFSPQGEFQLKFGYDVTASGPDKASKDDYRERWTVEATGGTFSVGFESEQASLPYNATASAVEAAINALPKMLEAGDSVTVTGGPGDATGSRPYEIAYKGNLGHREWTTNRVFNMDESGLTGTVHSLELNVVTYGGGDTVCEPTAGDVCKRGVNNREGPEGSGGFALSESVAVDQTNGNVFVLSGDLSEAIQEYTAAGRYITGFGKVAEAEPVSSSPEKIHNTRGVNGLAVDGATGDVYFLDALSYPKDVESRVMVFAPQSPGDYEHYVYTGKSHDLFTGTYSSEARGLERDGSGDFYISHDDVLYRFGKEDLTKPQWTVTAKEGGGTVVEPATGDLLRYATRSEQIERFSASDGTVTEKFGTGEKPTGDTIYGITSMALNPNLSWSAGRPPGALYADLPQSEDRTRQERVIVLARPLVFPPRIDSESASFVGSSSARLSAQIDPNGTQTSYRFQYGTEACVTHSCAEAPLGGGELGSGSADLAAAVELGGLSPDTTYRYRVLASNVYGTVEGAEQTFTTYAVGTAGLPDGRVYELVSPPFKDGGEVPAPDPEIGSCNECKPAKQADMEPMQSAPGGDAVVYQGNPFSTAGEAIGVNEYLAKRTPEGWRSEDLTPQGSSPTTTFGAFSADLSTAVLPWPGVSPALAPEAPAGQANIYVRGGGGGWRPLLIEAPLESPREQLVEYAGASADLGHVVFESNDALTAATQFAPPAQMSGEEHGLKSFNLYEFFDGQLRLVNVLPGNKTTVPAASLGETPRNHYIDPDVTNAVSADGSRIFWTDKQTGRVYVRENGEQTVEIPDPGGFLAASSDGSKVLLRDGHVYDLQGGTTVDLTAGKGGFEGVLGTSEDLARVYFVDTEALTGGEENEYGAVAAGHADNLYVYEAGAVRFIARLAAGDNFVGANEGVWRPSTAERLAHVTADGRYLAFMSQASLTPYESRGDFEVYEYDGASKRLTCASCNPAGIAPLGGSRLSLISPFVSRHAQPRNLSDNGRVFFDSRDALSPYDTNGGVEDVYEYEPDGTGTCARPAGCVFLISSGGSPYDSNFVAASATGDDVFFTTRDRLSPADRDELYDLYDARVGGGFPESTAPMCTGAGCQGVPGSPPIFATPSSVTFAGVGNFETPASTVAAKSRTPKKQVARCPKGRTRKHGHCVKKAKRAKRAGAARGRPAPASSRRGSAR